MSLNQFEPLANLHNATIYYIKQDITGNLWVASSAGFTVLDAQTNTTKTYNSSNSNLPRRSCAIYIYRQQITNLDLYRKRHLFFGIKSSNPSSQERFADGFINNQYVHWILEDRKGNFLFCYGRKKGDIFRMLILVISEMFVQRKMLGFTGLRIIKIVQEASGNFWFIGSRGAIKAQRGINRL